MPSTSRVAIIAVALLAPIYLVRAQAPAPTAPTAIRVLTDRYWAWSLREDPLAATMLGVYDRDDRLPINTPASVAARADTLRAFLGELQRIDTTSIGEQDRITAEILKLQWTSDLDDIDRRVIRIPINAEGGFHTDFASIPSFTPARTAADIDHYAARLAQLPRYFREYIAWMRQGMADGYVPPAILLQGADATMQLITPNAEASLFYEPVKRLPLSVPEAERTRVATAVARVIADSVSKAYTEVYRFFREEYRPAARATFGVRALPGGEAYYRARIKFFTTLDFEPDSIHALGLREVTRIRAEMDRVRTKTGFTGTHAAFLAYLRTNPRFHPKTGDELLMVASRISKHIDHELPRLFRHLPRQPYGVVPVPTYLEKKYTTGRYIGAPITGIRAGEYWVNMYAPETRALYTLEALTLHEAVPGHHLQTSLAQEMDGLPEFRKNAYFSAYSEGWGLYSERLGLEVGFYTDPYNEFGRLTYDMWRACRLVIDTGIHWDGWTRQQAIDYLASNTALPLHEVETEIDRYIGWPAQALSYKIGELEIRKLRAEAEAALGPKFDIRAFHDVVLRNGSIPLTTLDREVRAWIADGGK